VGLLDIDICGPSVPRMLGLEGQEVHQSNQGWSSVYFEDNLAVMSIGFLLPNKDDAIIWRGPRKNGLIKQFLTDVLWEDLDYLIIDTPPGTSDEQISIIQYLKKTTLAGAVVVTTPQEVALADVRKEAVTLLEAYIPRSVKKRVTVTQERFASASTTRRQALQTLQKPIDITKAEAQQHSCDFRPQVQVIRKGSKVATLTLNVLSPNFQEPSNNSTTAPSLLKARKHQLSYQIPNRGRRSSSAFRLRYRRTLKMLPLGDKRASFIRRITKMIMLSSPSRELMKSIHSI
jgi:hypothetical protein